MGRKREQRLRALPELLSRVRYHLGESGWANVAWLQRLHAAAAQQRLPQARDRTERNILYLYLDMFWAGIFMAVMAFNGTYALRLGAPNALLGWLSSIPSLVSMLVLLPSAAFLEGREDRAPWLHWSLAIGRGLFLGAAVVPWLFPQYAAHAVVAVLILRALPMQFYSAGFSPMLADVIPVRDRARVMANRSIIMSATVAVCTFLFGLWMDAAARIPWAAFPTNYQIVYFIGTAAGLLSTYAITRIELPKVAAIRRERARTAEVPDPAPDAVTPPLACGGEAGDTPDGAPVVARRPSRHLRRAWGQVISTGGELWARLRTKVTQKLASARALFKENPEFTKIVVNTFVFDTGAWLVGPLYTILFVNELGAADSWIGLNTTLAHIGVIGGNLIWRRLLDRWGAGLALRRSVPLAASYAILVALFPNLTLILLFGVLINLINPGVSLSHINTLYQICPRERRASFMAIYATVANVGAFAAPMVGVALSNVIDIRWILLAGGLIRLVGAGLFQINRIHLPEVAVD